MITQSVHAPLEVPVANPGSQMTRSWVVQRAALLFVGVLLTACSSSAAPSGDFPTDPSTTATEWTDPRVEGGAGSGSDTDVEDAGSDGSGAAASGLVTTPDGQPVPGIVVEFKSVPDCPGVCSQPHTTTDSGGWYRIELGPGTYNALCVVEDFDYECGVRGSETGGHPISVPPASQRIDFIVCELDQYPECLLS